jgi:dTDP-4-dehydrorhamnose reductase
MPKILVTGATGQLGSEIVERVDEHAYEIVAMDHKSLDVSNQ